LIRLSDEKALKILQKVRDGLDVQGPPAEVLMLIADIINIEVKGNPLKEKFKV
jgi:hypothetical protein